MDELKDRISTIIENTGDEEVKVELERLRVHVTYLIDCRGMDHLQLGTTQAFEEFLCNNYLPSCEGFRYRTPTDQQEKNITIPSGAEPFIKGTIDIGTASLDKVKIHNQILAVANETRLKYNGFRPPERNFIDYIHYVNSLIYFHHKFRECKMYTIADMICRLSSNNFGDTMVTMKRILRDDYMYFRFQYPVSPYALDVGEEYCKRVREENQSHIFS